MDKKLTLGWGVTGAHGFFSAVVDAMARWKGQGVRVIPILSPAVQRVAGGGKNPAEWRRCMEEAAGEKAILTVAEAEPLGPGEVLDGMVVAPLTGTTLAKMAHGIYDTSVLTAVKAAFRNQKPLVLALCTNDGLGLNAVNWARLLTVRHVYFVPFFQDRPLGKPASLQARFDLLDGTIQRALEGEQLQPLLREGAAQD
ncbi:MAG: dipicolinate synthase subunit B [Bacillota bacterium]|nr:dipicolinate synthase subunit B [Bacillota bacterium]